MASQQDFETVAERIRNEYDGSIVVTVRDDFINLSVDEYDTSDVKKSVPEDGGPFATIDNPRAAIPDTILEIAESAGYEVQLLGHGTGLHLHVK